MFNNEWSYLNSNQFPETANLYKRFDPKNVEEETEYKGAQKFKFRILTKDDGTYEPIRGLRRRDKVEIQIEVADNLQFTPGDIIEFYNNVDYRFTIKKVEIRIDDRNKSEYLNRIEDWPELIETTHIKVITLG